MGVSRRTLPLRNFGRGMRIVVVSLFWLVNLLLITTTQRFSGGAGCVVGGCLLYVHRAENSPHASEVSVVEEVLGCSTGTHALPELRESLDAT